MTTLGEYLTEHTPMSVVVRSRRNGSPKVHLPDGAGPLPRCGTAEQGEYSWYEKNPSVLFDEAEMCEKCLALGGSAPADASGDPGGDSPPPECARQVGADRARELAEKARDNGADALAAVLEDHAEEVDEADG